LREVSPTYSEGYSSSGREVEFSDWPNVVVDVRNSNIVAIPSDAIKQAQEYNDQLDALSSAGSIVNSELKEELTSKLIGEKISFFSNIAGNQRRSDLYSFIEPTITRFGTLLIV
jgi:hypothetical protein